MSFLGWLFATALIEEYKHIFFGCLIGIPLCFVHPFLGIAIGSLIAFIAKKYGGKNEY